VIRCGALVLVAAVLAACGDDDGDDRNPPPIVIDGDRARVELVLDDAMSEGDTVDAVIELVIPASTTVCD